MIICTYLLLQMIYNAEGILLKPFVCHNGDLPKGVQEYFNNDLGFAETHDGQFDESVLIEISTYIEK